MRRSSEKVQKTMTQDAYLNTLIALQPLLQLTAEKILNSAADAEDTVQEAVIELWEKREQMAHVVNLEAYAIQAVKNRCVSLLRKRHEVATSNIEILGDISDEELRSEVALTEERAARLDGMMARLPERQREAVEMKYIKQMSHEEMQRRLGMTSTNVYATLSRAISTLKSMVKQ